MLNTGMGADGKGVVQEMLDPDANGRGPALVSVSGNPQVMVRGLTSSVVMETDASGRARVVVEKTTASRSAKSVPFSVAVASATSAEIDLSAYKQVMLKVILIGATSGGSVKLHGAFATGDATVQVYDSGVKTTSFFSAFLDNPGFLQVELVRTDGTWTVEVMGIQ